MERSALGVDPPEADWMLKGTISSAIWSGFTLLELLIVIAILAVVIGAVGGVLAGGIRVWDVARNFNTGETEAVAALEVMERDLSNTFHFYDIPFNGEEARVSFPGLVSTAETPALRMGKVIYSLDDSGSLTRTAVPYPEGEEWAELLITGPAELDLTYYARVRDEEQGTLWQRVAGQATNLPARVDIQLTVDSRDRRRKITRTVLLPAAMTP